MIDIINQIDWYDIGEVLSFILIDIKNIYIFNVKVKSFYNLFCIFMYSSQIPLIILKYRINRYNIEKSYYSIWYTCRGFNDLSLFSVNIFGNKLKWNTILMFSF